MYRDGIFPWVNEHNHTMPELVEWAAETYGDRIFLTDPDGRKTSFSSFKILVEQAARGFLAAGVEFGDRVAIWAPNSSEWIVACCGAQMIGAIMVPVNTRFKGLEAGYILRKTRAKILCIVEPFLGMDYIQSLRDAFGGASEDVPVAELPELRQIISFDGVLNSKTVTSWTHFLKTGDSGGALALHRAKVRPETTCDILFTSGTTGNPKGAMHGHGQALWMAGLWNEANDLKCGDKELIINPFFHSFGYRAGWVPCLLGGLTVYPVAVFDAAKVLEIIDHEQISVLMGPPTLFISILEHPDRAKFNLSSLRAGHTGSSNVPVELIRSAYDELKFEVFLTSFGLTEATALVSMCHLGDKIETIAKTLGRPIPETSLRFINMDGETVADGESGELLVRGPNVMQGYFEDPEATAQTIDEDGWLHTGDIGCIDVDGNLRIFDRIKDIVIVGGFNAYPAEIEAALRNHPKILDVAIIGVPDKRMGEVCGACTILVKGETLTLDELTVWARERLANFKVPRHLFIIDEIPKTALGKAQKFLLRKQVLA